MYIRNLMSALNIIITAFILGVNLSSVEGIASWTNDSTNTTPNQITINNQLQMISNPAPLELAVLETLLRLSPEKQIRALDQLSSTQYSGLIQTAQLMNHQFIRRLYDPLRPIVTTCPCEIPCDCDVLYNSITDFWFDAGYNRIHFNNDHCIDGFNLKGYEFSFGLQTSWGRDWTFGLAGSYEKDCIHYELGGTGRNHTFLGGLYALYRPGDYYFLSDLVIGYSHNHVNRQINIEGFHFRPRGNPHIVQGTVYVEAGKDLPLCGGWNTYLFQPFIGIEAGYFHFDRFRENGGNSLFNLTLSQRNHNTASGRLGVHFSVGALSSIVLAIDAAWQYRFTSLNNRNKEQFQQFGNKFSVKGLNLAKDSFDGAINIAANGGENWKIYVEANGQVWNNASAYNVFAGFQIDW